MTDMTPTDEVVIKADVLGRVRTSRERREQSLDEFERSGLTGQKFAEVVGIKYQTFATWAEKRRRQQGAYPAMRRPSNCAGWRRWWKRSQAVAKKSVAAGVGTAGRSEGANHRCQASGLGGGVVAEAGHAMLSFSGSLKVFVAVEACDMRKGFNGLHAVVTERLGEEPRAGALFVFSNRRHTRIKILCWDGTGLWVLTKRLEQGTFLAEESGAGDDQLKLTPQALAMLTDGVDLRGAKLRPWYEREG